MASVIGSKKCDAKGGLATRLDRLAWTPAGPEMGARNRQTDRAQSNAGKLQDRRRAAMARRQLIVCEKRTAGRRPIASVASLRRYDLFASQPARVGDVAGRRRAGTPRRQPLARQKRATTARPAIAARLAPL